MELFIEARPPFLLLLVRSACSGGRSGAPSNDKVYHLLLDLAASVNPMIVWELVVRRRWYVYEGQGIQASHYFAYLSRGLGDNGLPSTEGAM